MEKNAETDRDVLKRIVAMLLALADLAERACGMPLPVRSLLLWILRPAEAVAREFIGGSAQDAHWQRQAAAAIAVEGGNDPADAIELARSLRALALALKTLSREARRFSGRWATWTSVPVLLLDAGLSPATLVGCASMRPLRTNLGILAKLHRRARDAPGPPCTS